MPAKSKTLCPVESYARQVLSGKIVAGHMVRLACQRHLDDLQHGKARGLHFDHDAAQHVLDFFGWLMLPEGDKPFILAPWQVFIVGSLFGWKGPDGFRRFRTAYVEAGKGSGKSPLAGGIGLYGLVADGELAAEIYTAATQREQANITFRDAKRMAENSPPLASRLDIGMHNLADPASGSFMRAISSEHRGLDGKRVHFALIDELHEHPDSMVVDKMRAGVKGRDQALQFEITNSGHDRTTVCWRHREYSDKVLKNILQDDSWFAYVCGLDPCAKCSDEGKTQPADDCPNCDNWRDETKWEKANPNLGISLTKKYLAEQVREAVNMPAKAPIVRRLNFCQWTETLDRCIPMDHWDACARKINHAKLAGQTCYGGLDIGSTSDFTAFALLFPRDIEQPASTAEPFSEPAHRGYTLLSYFWLPEHPRTRDTQTQAAIDGWIQQGYIRTTPGSVVDYDEVLLDILDIVKPFALAGLGFDRGFQGSQMGNNLQKHFGELVQQVPQGILSLNAPFRELLESLIAERIEHDSNPCARWQASNVVAETRGGLMKPSKERSSEKIDFLAAACMAMALAGAGVETEKSIYSTYGEMSAEFDPEY